ncbi:MAG: hypothetical protein K2N36_08675, partial [Ruminiclostridium sp.]|nr:hypothetical protein [Ruminiclostridium sp.]
VFIAVISFILGLASGIIFAIVKISKKFEYELETMFANREDDPDIEELYALDGYQGYGDLEDDGEGELDFFDDDEEEEA